MKYLHVFFVLCLCAVLVNAVPITEQIYFYHYSTKTQINGTELKIGQELDPNINPKLPWKFFIHGWTTSPEISPWFQTGKEAYFKKGKYNIVFVDWSKPANQTYLESVRNAIGSGEFVGKFILHLVENNVSLDKIHLLGHSLGSHMSGFCGKYVINALEGQQIGRITGLDPAGPVYELSPLAPHYANKDLLKSIILPANLRLDKSDAKLVDVIHTDAGKYGIQSNIGHIDFYANGGRRIQPGCETIDDENCSHARSTRFFVESINNDNFVARECENFERYQNGCCENNKIANLGEYTDVEARGNFYLVTNSEPPYAKGDDKRTILDDVCNFQPKTTTVNYYLCSLFFMLSVIINQIYVF